MKYYIFALLILLCLCIFIFGEKFRHNSIENRNTEIKLEMLKYFNGNELKPVRISNFICVKGKEQSFVVVLVNLMPGAETYVYELQDFWENEFNTYTFH